MKNCSQYVSILSFCLPLLVMQPAMADDTAAVQIPNCADTMSCGGGGFSGEPAVVIAGGNPGLPSGDVNIPNCADSIGCGGTPPGGGDGGIIIIGGGNGGLDTGTGKPPNCTDDGTCGPTAGGPDGPGGPGVVPPGTGLTEVIQTGSIPPVPPSAGAPDNLLAGGGDIPAPSGPISPEALGALAPAAGGNMTGTAAQDDAVLCMNAFLQNRLNTPELKQKCAGSSDNNPV